MNMNLNPNMNMNSRSLALSLNRSTRPSPPTKPPSSLPDAFSLPSVLGMLARSAGGGVWGSFPVDRQGIMELESKTKNHQNPPVQCTGTRSYRLSLSCLLHVDVPDQVLLCTGLVHSRPQEMGWRVLLNIAAMT